jgi:hypothetical protein
VSEERSDRNSFEEIARALVEELNRAVERLSEVDVDEIVRTARAEAERARRWVEDVAGSLREQGWDVPFGAAGAWEGASEPAGGAVDEDPLREAGPHPLDLPTPDQGLALAALDSGRWRLEPGTSALTVQGDGRDRTTRSAWCASFACATGSRRTGSSRSPGARRSRAGSTPRSARSTRAP